MGKTYSLTINDAHAHLTQLDITSEELVAKLATGNAAFPKANMVAFGEYHDEYKSREKISEIITANKDVVNSLNVELNSNFQPEVDSYLSIDPTVNDKYYNADLPAKTLNYLDDIKAMALQREQEELKEVVAITDHAPSENDPEELQNFTTANESLFKTAKAGHIPVTFFDASTEEKSHYNVRQEEIEAEINDLKAARQIFGHLFNEDKKYQNPSSMNDDEYRSMLENIQADLENYYVVNDNLWDLYPTGKDMHQAYADYCKDVAGHEIIRGERREFNSRHVIPNQGSFVIESASKLIELENKLIEVTDEKMRMRNPIMAENILNSNKDNPGKETAAPAKNGLGIIITGKDHIINCEKTGSLAHDIEAKSNGEVKVVTVDIVPVDKQDMEKMGSVFLGGKDGADFTIFIESRVSEETLEHSIEIPFEKSKNIESQYKELHKQSDTAQTDIAKAYEQYLMAMNTKKPEAIEPLQIANLADKNKSQYLS